MSLNDMLSELRYEARISGDFAHGSHLQERHIALLRRVQEELYDEHDWPMLKGVETVTVPAGQRYTAYPERTDFEGVLGVWGKAESSEQWSELTYGITVAELNHTDSDADERATSIRRWQHYVASGAEITNTNMFEVWPIPSEPNTLRFHRKRKLDPLVDPGTDHSTLDGPSIVLHAAAEILAGQKAEDAPLKLQKATQRVNLARARQQTPDNRRVVFGGVGRMSNRNRGPRWPTS